MSRPTSVTLDYAYSTPVTLPVIDRYAYKREEGGLDIMLTSEPVFGVPFQVEIGIRTSGEIVLAKSDFTYHPRDNTRWMLSREWNDIARAYDRRSYDDRPIEETLLAEYEERARKLIEGVTPAQFETLQRMFLQALPPDAWPLPGISTSHFTAAVSFLAFFGSSPDEAAARFGQNSPLLNG